MMPRAAALVSESRNRFYACFTAAMQVPVLLNQKNSSTNHAIVTWVDQWQHSNYLYVYAYLAPDELLPERPLILRASINKAADTIPSRQRRGNQGQNETWGFDLTLLPEELLDFAPWLAGLAQSQAGMPDIVVPDPPHPLTFQTIRGPSFEDAWTQTAWQCLQSAPTTLLHPNHVFQG